MDTAKETKLTEQEMESLKEIKQENQALVQELGAISLIKKQLEERQTNAWEFRAQLIEKEKTFTEALHKAYGDGSINLEEGTFVGRLSTEE